MGVPDRLVGVPDRLVGVPDRLFGIPDRVGGVPDRALTPLWSRLLARGGVAGLPKLDLGDDLVMLLTLPPLLDRARLELLPVLGEPPLLVRGPGSLDDCGRRLTVGLAICEGFGICLGEAIRVCVGFEASTGVGFGLKTSVL